jgi:hypothetical protein
MKMDSPDPVAVSILSLETSRYRHGITLGFDFLLRSIFILSTSLKR